MNADALLQGIERTTIVAVEIAIVWSLVAVSLFFITGTILNLDDWRERKREAARYRR